MTGQQPANFDLPGVFSGQEASLRSELDNLRRAGHPGVQGEGTEQSWIDLLNRHLPRRYQATRAIVVDSEGHRSQQIDAVICDRQFSPEFWQSGDHRYVPAESVYVALEIKPTFNREYLTYAADKIASVRALKRTSAAFGWSQGQHKPREDFIPLGGMLAGSAEWADGLGTAFQKALVDADSVSRVDLGCALGAGTFEIPAGGTPAEVEFGNPGHTLFQFLLIVLRRLQVLGTAPAIDYTAYEKWLV